MQEVMVDRLQADPYFDDLTVLHQKKHDIQNEIDTAIASLGICVVIVTPSADIGKSRDVLPPYFDAIDFIVRVQESVITNQTGKSSLAVAEHVLALLHNWRPDGVYEALYAVSPTIQMVDHPDAAGLLIYDIHLRTQGGIRYDVDTVADPVVGVAGGQCTITCATTGAVVVYVIDSATHPKPTPRNANAVPAKAYFYTAPFAVSVGQVVIARAWLSGYVTSKAVTLTVT